MSIKIVYRGFDESVSSADAIGILTRLFKGDRARAEDMYLSPGQVLQSVETEAEIQLVLPRLQKLGLRCEVVNELPADEPVAMRDPSVVIRFVNCPACGQKQMPADACRYCGESFVVKREAPSSLAESEPQHAVSRRDVPDSAKAGFLGGLLGGGGGIALPSAGVLVGVAAVAGLAVFGKDLFFVRTDEASGKAAPQNPLMQLMSGIMSADPNEVGKSMSYDPESGSNPYAERLKSLGIDPKEFASSQGIEGGEIDAAKINEMIEKNPMLKKAIEDATSKSGKSTGDTETDDKIRAATGE